MPNSIWIFALPWLFIACSRPAQQPTAARPESASGPALQAPRAETLPGGTINAVAAVRAPGSYVFRATYHRGLAGFHLTGSGGEHMWPSEDQFTIVEVLEGTLPQETVSAVVLGPAATAYPSALEEGKTYTLRFTPRDRAKTAREIEDNVARGITTLAATREELEEVKDR